MTPQRHQGFLIIADSVTAKCESHDPDNSVQCDVEDLPCPLFSTSQSPWSRGGICRWFDNHCHLNISLLSSPALGFTAFYQGHSILPWCKAKVYNQDLCPYISSGVQLALHLFNTCGVPGEVQEFSVTCPWSFKQYLIH